MKKTFIVFLVFSLLTVCSGNSFAQVEQDYTYYYNLGYAKLIDGSFTEAINIFDQALKINSNCSEAYLGLGIAYRQLNQLDKALESTLKALQYNPNYYKAYYNLGLIYEQQGNKKEALNAYKTFVKKVPESRNIPDLKTKITQLEAQ